MTRCAQDCKPLLEASGLSEAVLDVLAGGVLYDVSHSELKGPEKVFGVVFAANGVKLAGYGIGRGLSVGSALVLKGYKKL